VTYPRRRLVVASVLLVLEAVACALFVTESVTGAIVAVGFTCVSLWVHVVLHECGHFVAAKLLRLPVVEVLIAPFTGWRNEVRVRPTPSATALPLRMMLFYLSGPVANLCTAAALGTAAALTGTAVIRIALLGAAFVAALLGVVNLIPGTSPRSDGRNLLRWLSAPEESRAALRAGRYDEEVIRAVRALAGHGDRDPVRDNDDPLTSFQRRWSVARSADLMADAERLAALARADSTDPTTAAEIGQLLTVQFGLWYLYAAVVHGSPVEHTEVLEISDLAQLAFQVQPHLLSARVAMALAHVLNERPEQARSVLADIRPGADPPDLCGVAVLLRAIAECHLGRRADADGLIAAAGSDYPQLTHVVAAIRAADPVPRLFAVAPDAR
jgi:Zn-dependent protease